MNIKGIFFVVLFFILMGSVNANVVTLYLPADGSTNTTSNDITFQCKFTGEDIANLTFYHDLSGSLSPNQTDSSPVNDTYSSFTLNDIPNGDYVWNCYATTTNNTQFSAASNFDFSINVLDPNAPRFNGTIPAQSWAEDTNKSNAFDLDIYFSDPNSDPLTFSVSGNSSINVIIGLDNSLNFSQAGNWKGVETVIFTASDGTQSVSSNSIVLTVTNVNDGPYVKKNLSHKSWSKDNNITFDLDEYFGDIDGDSLNYSASTLSHITAIFDQTTGEVTLKATSSDWTGVEAVTFSASDGSASVSAFPINLTVSQGNVAPTIDTSSDAPGNVTVGKSYLFTITKSDSDGDSMTLQWYVDGELISGATGDSYSYYADDAGGHNISVIVSDGSLTTSKVWTFTVAAAGSVTETGRETEKDGEVVAAEGLCGNGEVDEGEDCDSCMADVKCEEGEVCEGGECVSVAAKQQSYNWLIFLVVVLLGGVGTAIYYFIKQSEIKKGSIFDEDEKPVVDGKQPIIKEKISPKAVEEKIINLAPLVDYIRDSLAAGKSKQEIESILLSRGWNVEQVKQAFDGVGVK